MFTYVELSSFTKKQLLEMINWYNLGAISKYAKKSVLIDFILEKLYVDEAKEEPPMSARIRRIKESSR